MLINKIYQYVRSSKNQMFRYFIIGITGVVLDLSTLYILKDLAGLNAVTAVVINQIFMLNYVFFLNKYWSFGVQKMIRKQVFRFLILSSFNYLISIIWIWIFAEIFEVNYLLARTMNIALSVGWNFILYKHWVYKQ